MEISLDHNAVSLSAIGWNNHNLHNLFFAAVAVSSCVLLVLRHEWRYCWWYFASIPIGGSRASFFLSLEVEISMISFILIKVKLTSCTGSTVAFLHWFHLSMDSLQLLDPFLVHYQTRSIQCADGVQLGVFNRGRSINTVEGRQKEAKRADKERSERSFTLCWN